MPWFKRSDRWGKPQSQDQLTAEVREFLDPYSERTIVGDGDHALVALGHVLEKNRLRMERIDTDPDASWAPEEVMSQEETVALFM